MLFNIPLLHAISYSDLSVTKAVLPTTAHPGETVAFTIVAYNGGPHEVFDITVNDVIPAEFTVTNANASAGSWSAPDWSIPYMTNNTSATLTITATINNGANGDVYNTASISASFPLTLDLYPSNNASTRTVTIENQGPLSNWTIMVVVLLIIAIGIFIKKMR
ncbi:MAG: DUF11 domain-containing protein [Bacteroidales bacterium]|nr:DUF11 domain-containing protein [Bacteroidales bacterium]MCF8387036.1 DUF11 domain-containing protein [Bacteroidales bacterium]MCF8398753.1 DUF11 domain-containing protein [Bacteroidales bacterium]